MLDWWSLLVGAGLVALRSRQALVVENLLLRQQLAVALRAHRRPNVRWHDRLFWIAARRLVERRPRLAGFDSHITQRRRSLVTVRGSLAEPPFAL